MRPEPLGNDWQKAIWKIVSNPAIEVMAVIAVVIFSAWIVVQAEAGERQPVFPVPFAHR